MKPKKRSLATPSTIAVLLFVLAAASPFALAQRPASLHIDWTIVLTGPVYNGMTPIGNSDYEVQNTFRRFEADCDQVNGVRGVHAHFVGLTSTSTESTWVRFLAWIKVAL